MSPTLLATSSLRVRRRALQVGVSLGLGCIAVVNGSAAHASNPSWSPHLSAVATADRGPAGQPAGSFPTLTVTRGSGAVVEPGSEVGVGLPLRLTLRGFHPGTSLRIVVGERVLVSGVATDGMGAFRATVVLPRSLPSTTYLLAGVTGEGTATFPFYVYNPPASAPSGKTPVPQSPISSVPSTVTVVVPPQADQPGSLPSTGADLAWLSMMSIVSLAVGALLRLVGRPRRTLRPRTR